MPGLPCRGTWSCYCGEMHACYLYLDHYGPCKDKRTLHLEDATAPPGWFVFGTHVDTPGRLEFSAEQDEGGMPKWERPVSEPTEEEAERD